MGINCDYIIIIETSVVKLQLPESINISLLLNILQIEFSVFNNIGF